MNVRLSSVYSSDPHAIVEEISNQTWRAIVAVGNAYEPDKIPLWDGNHDFQKWTSDQCGIMAKRLEQAAMQLNTLHLLSKTGGAIVS